LIEAVGGAIWLIALQSSDISNITAHAIIVIAILIEHLVQGYVLNQINDQGTLAQVSRAN